MSFDIYEYEEIKTKLRKQGDIMRSYSVLNKLRSTWKITRAQLQCRAPLATYLWCIRSIWSRQEPPLPRSWDISLDAVSDGIGT